MPKESCQAKAARSRPSETLFAALLCSNALQQQALKAPLDLQQLV